MKTKSCTSWKTEHRASGRTVVTRRCGSRRAEIVSGDGTYYTLNVYSGKTWLTRKSRRTLAGAKRAAMQEMKGK